MVNPAEDEHIAINARAVALDDRAADRGHVALDVALDDHVAAEGERAVFQVATHDD